MFKLAYMVADSGLSIWESWGAKGGIELLICTNRIRKKIN